MDHLQGIDVGLNAGTPYHEIARKIYLTYPTKAFAECEEQQYEIFNEISTYFDISITCIQVAGSAKTGRSFHKKQDFVPGTSDLDIAIIDTRLFAKYAEIVYRGCKGGADLTKFPLRNGASTSRDYFQYLARGIFRPDLMTVGHERAAWNSFFSQLSQKHTKLFGSISAAIYLSQTFFEGKQRSAIKNYADKGI